MSSSAGSFVLASFCAARRMNFCLFIASSRARIDFWRPTKSGTTMCGKTMMSRSGRSGTRSPPPCGGWSFGSRFSFRKSIGPPFPLGGLGRLLEQDDRLLLVGDDLLRDENLLDVRLRRDVVHHIEHDVLHDRPQAARPRLPLQRLAGNGREGTVGEAEVHPLHLEELLVLPGQRVLWLLQDSYQSRLVQLLEGGDDRKTADKLGDEPELEQILGLHLVQEIAHAAFVLATDIGAKAHSLDPDPTPADVVESYEGSAADE